MWYACRRYAVGFCACFGRISEHLLLECNKLNIKSMICCSKCGIRKMTAWVPWVLQKWGRQTAPGQEQSFFGFASGSSQIDSQQTIRFIRFIRYGYVCTCPIKKLIVIKKQLNPRISDFFSTSLNLEPGHFLNFIAGRPIGAHDPTKYEYMHGVKMKSF